MFPDFQDLIDLLNKHKAKYLVIGAYAVSRHAQPRVTKDLDFLVQATRKNAGAVFRALEEFGAPLRTRISPDAEPRSPTRKLTSKDFEDLGSWYTMGVPPVAIDILTEIPGVTFDVAWKNRTTEVINTATGLTAHFISRADLIAAKLASARPQDLADVDALRQAAQAGAKLSSPRPFTGRKQPNKKSPPEP